MLFSQSQLVYFVFVKILRRKSYEFALSGAEFMSEECLVRGASIQPQLPFILDYLVFVLHTYRARDKPCVYDGSSVNVYGLKQLVVICLCVK